MKNEENKKSSNLFVIILFVVIIIFALFFPKIYNFIENQKLPEVPKTQTDDDEENKIVTTEDLSSLHTPIMRTSIYDENTYYSLDTFTISNMSNADILFNAFINIEEVTSANVTIKKSNAYSRCSRTPMEFSSSLIGLRVQNVLGKNVKFNLESFYVPVDSTSSYKGNWRYDGANSRFIYDGVCTSNAKDTSYYDLRSHIKAEYENNDIIVYEYLGFAKVKGNDYTIYSDANMTVELTSGTLSSVEELNDIFEKLDNNSKKIYKYTYKNTLCSYNEYCLYKGEYVNEL